MRSSDSERARSGGPPPVDDEAYRTLFRHAATSMWIEDVSRLREAIRTIAANGGGEIAGYLDRHPEFAVRAASLIQVVDVNDATLELYGVRRREELLGPLAITLDLSDPVTVASLREDIIALAAGKRSTARESIAVTPSGRRMEVAIRSFIPAERDRHDLMLVNVLDVTELRRTGRELAKNEERFRSIVESMSEAVIIVDAQTVIVHWNRAASRMLGYLKEEVVGRPLESVLPHAVTQRVRLALESPVAADGPSEQAATRKEGRPLHIEYSCSAWQGDGAHYVSLVVRDVTQRRQMEARLREQAQLLDIASDVIIVTDMNRVVRYWNRSAETLFGWSAAEAVGKHADELFELLHRPEELDAALATLLRAGQWEGERRMRTREGREITGETRWTLVRNESGLPVAILFVTTDVTARKLFETELIRAQRLEGVAGLAAGIAHHLNNILTPILTGTEALMLRAAEPPDARILELMKQSTERAAAVVRQVLTFARGAEGERSALALSPIMQDVEKIVRASFPNTISVRLSVEPDLWPVVADGLQIQQAVMNICMNARDAMPHGGRLFLGARNVVLDPSFARMHPGAHDGSHAVIQIEDTGTGMSAATKAKLFNPFFTTKGFGKGSGMGLSTVLSVVQSHGGFIDVYSEEGRGSTFLIYLPAVMLGEAAVAIAQTLPAPQGGGELILLADDETAVREVGRRILEHNGYRVVTAADGTEALALFVSRREEVRAVIVDMIMPHLDGAATIRALRRVSPELPILATSGFTGEQGPPVGGAPPGERGADRFLPKPYTANELLSRVRELIAAAGQDADAQETR